MKDINYIVKALKDYDLKEVADYAGLHHTTLRNWVKGKYKPRIDSLVKVAEVLGYKIIIV